MAGGSEASENCFDAFDDVSPKRKEPSIQVLYDYEKHYMELVRKYEPEISKIANMLSDFRREQETFYGDILPQISNKLNQDVGIDKGMKDLWIKRLTENIERSFNLSETLINDFATKKIDEFKNAVKEKLREL